VTHELTRALRNLLRAPRFCAIVVVTLATAIGGAGGLFSLLDAAVLRTLPVRDPERLIAIFPANGEALFGITMPTLKAFGPAAADVLENVCGVSQGSALVVEVNGVNRLWPSESVTGDCAAVLGLQAARGRLMTPEDAPLTGRSASVVVISHRFWTDTLGGAPDVVGQVLRVEGQPMTIIGVLPASYRGLNADEMPDVSIPLGTMWQIRGIARVLALHMIGRLRPGVTPDEARQRLQALWPAVWKATNADAAPGTASRAGLAESLRVDGLSRGFSSLRGRYERPLIALVALAALLVLVACVNVGALFLSRTVGREQQLAVQMALGASRGRVAAGLALEGITLALCAAGAAVPVAWWTSRVIASTMWTGLRPLTMEVTPAAPTLAMIATTGFVAGLLVGLPALLAVWLRPWQLAASSVRGVFVATARWRVGLIATQIAISLVLVFSAALFIKNLGSLRALDRGYAPDRLQFARLELVFGAPRAYDYDAYFRTLLERVSSLPEVESAAFAAAFPTSELRHMTALFPVDRQTGTGEKLEAQASMDRVSPGFVRTAGIRLLAGREFRWQDTDEAPPVAILTEPLAARLFPEGDAIGNAFRIPGRKPDTYTVVGVVSDFSPGDPRIRNVPRVYIPAMQDPAGSSAPNIVFRLRDRRGVADAIRAAVEPLGRHRITFMRTTGEQADRLLIQERVLSALSSGFAGLAMLVGALGLYALLAQAVTRRLRELGLRMALGSSRRGIVALVLSEAMRMIVVGIAIGLPLALASGRAARALLYESSAYDPAAMAAALVLITAVGGLAAVIPAMRAARTDVATALRCE
jgi:predicted permease